MIQYVARMEKPTATNVKLGRKIFSVGENVLAKTAQNYIIQYVARMEKHTATNVKLEKTMLTVGGNVLAKENLEDTEKSTEQICLTIKKL